MHGLALGIRSWAMPVAAVAPDSAVVRSVRTDSLSALPWTALIQLQGVVDAEARLQRQSWNGEEPQAESDLYLRRLEIAGTGSAADWLSAQFVLKVENLGLDPRDAPASVLLDEGHLDLGREANSPYLVCGLRSQPFGQFASHLITDPLTQQAYELKTAGLTLGYNGPQGLSGSMTLYKGTAHLDGLFAAGVFDTTQVRREPITVHHADAFVAAAEAEPIHGHLIVAGQLVSEPGTDHRNLSVDASVTVTLSRPGITVDAEWIRALQRETYSGAARSFHDATLSLTGSYIFAYNWHPLHHRRTFAGRRASIRSHPFVVSVRYDSFDDDGLAEAFAVWSKRDRASAGGRYTFRQAGIASFYGMAELGSTRYRGPAVRTGLESSADALVRLGLVF
jgi:hypothetical protein